MDALLVLTNVAIILLLGILCSLLSKRLKLSNMLVLVILGLVLGRIVYNGQPLFVFEPSFLIGIGVLALVMIVFDGSSRFRFKEVNDLSVSALRIIWFFMLFSILVITSFTNLLFFDSINVQNILFSIIFAIVVVGTDPGSVFAMIKDFVGERAKKVMGLLQIEAIINTPLIVLIPYLILDLIKNIELGTGDFLSSFISQIPAFLAQIIVGVGAGVLIGLIVFKTMQKVYSHQFSPVAVITAALLAYILAENLKGNGVLAVATLGLLFGNLYVKEKTQLQEFSYMLSNALEILVFVLVGLMIQIPLTLDFFLKSLFLFGLLVLCRAAAVFVAVHKSDFSFKEKLFMSLNMPKGIAVAVVAFTLALYQTVQMGIILDLIVVFLLYSLILAAVVNLFSKKFIQVDVKNMKEDNIPHAKLKCPDPKKIP
ncbi:MAG: cation:proton antiporter [Nanoarchaeota archaeon]|nr:cation:proton antiporter [Nanoarchaeota archaeon]MBU1321696.1 cation:proton antiporter [Nanoarchaeota archaeon]MBU1597276.1 cation:proton antiporter [Nanoarchaeota archaeon]MBU2442240.1 cation:proton antiporter [Nanoarchaeota archaeon]